MRVWNPHLEFGGLDERDVKEATFLLWRGQCSVHQRFCPEHVAEFRAEHPDGDRDRAPRVQARGRRARRQGGLHRAHPRVGRRGRRPGAVIGVGTEIHMVQRMAEEMPDKTIVSLDPLVCPCSTMFRIDEPHLAWCLETLVARRGREPDLGRRPTPPSGPGSRWSGCSPSPESQPAPRGTVRLVPAETPSISVVVITYEGARWVAAQAASIVQQTRPPDEVVLADDASTDATVAIARETLAPLGARVQRPPDRGTPRADPQSWSAPSAPRPATSSSSPTRTTCGSHTSSPTVEPMGRGRHHRRLLRATAGSSTRDRHRTGDAPVGPRRVQSPRARPLAAGSLRRRCSASRS